jgi:acyl carrier protein
LQARGSAIADESSTDALSSENSQKCDVWRTGMQSSATHERAVLHTDLHTILSVTVDSVLESGRCTSNRLPVMNERQRMDYATPDKPILALRQWILESGSRVDDGALQPDTNLFEEDYIDSLGVMSLIVLVEQLRGAPINEKDMSVQNFVSLRQMEKTFFAEGGDMVKTPTIQHPVSIGSTEHA